MTVLIGIAVTGVIPIIGGIVLLAAKKIKASSFWAGVLAYIIAMIVYTIISGIVSMSVMMSSGSMMGTETEIPTSVTAALSIALCVLTVLAMGICIGGCMKKTRTFKGAVSCGLGFGVGYLVTTAIGLVSMYSVFVQINSGAFDKLYAPMVEQGMMDKELVKSMKAVYTEFSAADGLGQTLAAAGLAMLFVAAAVFIMRGACAKKIFAGIGVSALILAAAGGVSAVIPNTIAGAVVVVAIGAAALIFAVRMRESVVPPEAPAVQDSFLDSVAKAQTEVTFESSSAEDSSDK